MADAGASFQTTRLGAGRHDGPDGEVCVMELASMLAGERFGDRPASVCQVIAALLRSYNDEVDDRRRQDLYRYAAGCVGTRTGYAEQLRRASAALAWAAGRRPRRRLSLRRSPGTPRPEDGPDLIARYVVRSIGRRGRWSDEAHRALLTLVLVERLIAMPGPLLGELVEHRPEMVEHAGGGQQLAIAELR